MPTYQTAPLYAPVFPTLVHNPYGVQPLRGNTLAHADLPSAGDAYYPSWKREADMAVLARLENNKLKEQDMLRGPFTQKGNFTYTTTRGPQGQAFEGQKLSGGVVSSLQGQTAIQKLLRDRKFQLDAIDQASFDTVSPERVKPAETPTDTFVVDQTFANLLSSLSEGLISPTLLGYTSQIMNFFLTKADKIPDHKFTEYDLFLENLATLLDGAFYSAAEAPLDLGQKSKRILKKLEKDIGGMSDFIRDFMNYLGEPTKTKAMRLAGIRNKLLSLINQSAQAGVEEARAAQADFEEGRRFGPGEAVEEAPPGGGVEAEPVPAAAPRRRGAVVPPAGRLEAFGFGPAVRPDDVLAEMGVGMGLFRRRY
jgi:hypothetical protein